jgi:hypothetical protein
VPTLFFTAVITDRKQKQEKMKKKRKNPRKLSPFERAATLDLPTTWQQRDKQINHPVFEHAKPTRGEIRSIGRSFRNGKKKGPTICDARFLNDDERIAVAPLLVGRSAPQFSPNSKFTICYPSYTSWKQTVSTSSRWRPQRWRFFNSNAERRK